MNANNIDSEHKNYISEEEDLDPFECFDNDENVSDDENEKTTDTRTIAAASNTNSITIDNNGINAEIESATNAARISISTTAIQSGSTATSTTTSTASSTARKSSDGTARDRTCGILSFHTKTESALLIHVRNTMAQKFRQPTSIKASAPSSCATNTTNIPSRTNSSITPADEVLQAIDEFCQNRHWMMHIGPEKGNDILIKEGLDKALQTYLLDIVMNHVRTTVVSNPHHPSPQQQQKQQQKKQMNSFVAVEMGTYCGYSSILLGKTLKKAVEDHGIKAHIYSVEIDPYCAEVANEMIQMASLQDIITVVLLGDNQPDATNKDNNISNSNHHDNDDEDDEEEEDEDDNDDLMMSEDMSVKILQESVLPPNCNKIDFLFLDHDKFLYLPSLLAFQRANLLQSGSLVVADNVLFAGIMDYVAYVRELKNQGVVDTKTIESRIEYWTENELLEAGEETLRDGVEITKFR